MDKELRRVFSKLNDYVMHPKFLNVSRIGPFTSQIKVSGIKLKLVQFLKEIVRIKEKTENTQRNFFM